MRTSKGIQIGRFPLEPPVEGPDQTLAVTAACFAGAAAARKWAHDLMRACSAMRASSRTSRASQLCHARLCKFALAAIELRAAEAGQHSL